MGRDTPAMANQPVPDSLVWATDFDVLSLDHQRQRRDGYLVVRSPHHPDYFFGNLLLFDAPPVEGDAARWERLFEAEFQADARIRHHTFGWDRADGALGHAREEFLPRGYELEERVGLIAEAGQLRAHPRESRDVEVRALEPAEDADAGLWEQVVELQVASRGESFPEEQHRDYAHTRLRDLRALFRAGGGSWYVALDPQGGEVVGSLGIVVTNGRGRFQTVDTAEAHRRRGICSRLVVEAAQRVAERYGAERFVIAADPGYHALGLYESLGFERAERVAAVFRQPTA
jgi:ribosomal protein S18 acetylase RimI-like enzyme